MVIGILQFELLIPEPESIKDKRRVVRSIKDRLHQEHQVSVAEVADHDNLSRALLGLACVGTDAKRVAEVLDHVTEKLRDPLYARMEFHLGECRRQVLSGVEAVESPEAPIDSDALATEMLKRFDEDASRSEGS
jgi:uncharacterized protein YlxP (DUF503 family)